MPEAESERHVGPAESLTGWDDIEDGELAHTLRVIERQAVGATCTPVVAGDRKLGEP